MVYHRTALCKALDTGEINFLASFSNLNLNNLMCLVALVLDSERPVTI